MLGKGAFIERLRAEAAGFLSEDFRRTFTGRDRGAGAQPDHREEGEEPPREAHV
jgi:hypothetical protein